MRMEVPVLQRCCFCLPLRPGLIAWAYFKLVINSLISMLSLFEPIHLYVNIHSCRDLLKPIISAVVMLLMLFVDIILHVILIIGARQKDAKYLRIYCFYGHLHLGLTLLLGMIMAGFTIKDMDDYNLVICVLIAMTTSMILYLCIQGYVIILVRSQIIKLNGKTSLRLENNAPDEDCTLTIEHAGV